MHILRRASVAVVAVALAGLLGGCAASVPDPPAAVGENYPGTCMPAEFTWPTDFLEALPSESEAVGGSIVGLRLEYIDERWAWRIRSASGRTDAFGERVDDPAAGRETLADVRTLEVFASRDVTLTKAEQTAGTSAYTAADRSGEEWPSPLIIEMARVDDAGSDVWRITMCDTATNAQSVITVK
ncbi:hypothetical protein ACTJKK_06455 [Microbacterium sp. 22179]|uniref:hypothetical protein n=1 Tax=Microbacterium sp. 22179 TaxID=3453886 RepID=UPI003F859F97